ncbi:MAG TPA: helix-turn-helix transcriptional regulator [Candidatus Hydrogenedentes bacterium]|nr:helix-turn-helix transcriptional regulator [Candidatus Hydrogenedentota bacterium]
MTPAAFFRQPDVQRLLARAARAAATPISVHCLVDGKESLRVISFGQRAACRHVAKLHGAPKKCQAHRVQATAAALRQNRAVPFVCHMGFACVAVPALPGANEGYTLTFGPFCPSETPQTLEADAVIGLADMQNEDALETFPADLSDIALLPANVPPEIALWTAEALRVLWDSCQDESDDENDAVEPPPTRRSKKKRTRASEYQSDLTAAALAMANPSLARCHVRNAVASAAATREDVAVSRARMLATVAAALEKSAAAGADITRAWAALPEFLGKMDRAQTEADLLGIVTDVLAILARQARKEDEGGLLERLDQMLKDRLPETVRLNDVAAELGVHPTTITHRLQRHFGLSYSEYVGKLRVARAKELLRRTHLTIADIARRVGINDPSNLGKLFARHEGMSPADCRAQHARKK